MPYLKSLMILVILGVLLFSSPTLALDSFSVSVLPNSTVINNTLSVNQPFNFTINNSDSTGANITDVRIGYPSVFTYKTGTHGSTALVNIEWTGFNPYSAIQTANLTPVGFVNNTTKQYIWFNLSTSTVGIYNFTITINDTNGNTNVTNVSFEVLGVVVNNFPSNREFGGSSVNISCSARSNNSLSNMTVRISNLSYYNQTPGQQASWSTVVWNNTPNTSDVSNLQNQTWWNGTLYGNYSDAYKYVLRCEANDTQGIYYKSADISFLVSLRNFSGYVKNSTGGNLSQANVSIYRFVEGVNGPPTETLVASTLTGPDGNFSLTNVNTTRSCSSLGDSTDVLPPMQCEPQFRIKVVYPNETNANQVGPSLPPFPRSNIFGFEGPVNCPPNAPAGMTCGPPKLSGSTIYTQNATVLNISAVGNVTSIPVMFGYEIVDQSLGYPLESNIKASVFSKLIVVPTNRNYTIMVLRDPQSFPGWPDVDICTAPGIMNATHCPSPPISNSSLGTLTAGSVVNVVVNLSFGNYNLTGCINVTGNNSAINVTRIVPKLVPWEGFVPPMKAEMQSMNFSDQEDFNYSDPRCPGYLARYRVHVMGSASGINYFIEFYGKNASSEAENPGSAVSVAAFESISSIQGNVSRNITLKPLAGSYQTGGDVNTSKIIINLFKNTGNKTECNVADNQNCFALSRPHVEIEVKDSNIYNGQSIKYTVEEFSSGSFKMPFLNSSTVKISIFDQGTSPTKKTLNLSQSINNITIYSFMPEKILPNGTRMEFNKTTEGMTQNIRFYRSGGNCDVFNPPESCALAGGNFSVGEFDPMKAMLAGKVNLRLTTPNVTLYFINVDLIASGPPEPDRSEQALTGSTNLQKAWRFGSMAPRIYDYVLIGVVDLTINSSWSYNMSIPALFDENWHVIWNISTSGTLSNVPEDYVDYNATSSPYRTFLTSAGMPCSFTNSSEECYINATEYKIWLKIPHFSAIQPTFTGVAPTGTTTTTTTTTTGGGSSTGSTSSGAYVTLAKGKVNITTTSITTSGKMIATVARYEDIAIRGMNITVVNNVANIKIMISKIPLLPSTIPFDISGKVYHYINIDKINITDSDINTVNIEFAVNKTWLTNNNVDASNITFYRWANNKWNDLSATKIAESTQEVFYNAKSSGLSVFIIGTKGGAPAAPTGAAITCIESWQCTPWSACTGTHTRTCTDSNNCGTTVNKPEESETCTVEKAQVPTTTPTTISILTTVIVIVVAIIACVFIFLERTKISYYIGKISKRN